MKDIDLVVLAVKGNKNAFSELIHIREGKLYKIAYMHVKNEQGALDIVGETVYRAYLNIKKLKNCQYFDTWLVKIVTNAAMDYLRKNKPSVPFDNLAIGEPFADASTIELYSLVDKLDSKQKTVIILKYFEGYKISEISNIMDCTESSVKNYLHKALTRLRLELKEEVVYDRA
ncbi:MAG: polymerase subunit sigma-70 [Clostridiales bacterium]|jgi:RNA polymerase sigma-70 factor (ECF subfamily)|nr:polymerase subunit sigma-70 [Clostridiales bacterium]